MNHDEIPDWMIDCNERKEVIELELDNELLFKIMLCAHEQDITLNKYVENVLMLALAEIEAKP